VSEDDPGGEATRCPPLPLVFGPPAAQLFGLYHAPAPASARGVGVVLCAPLGYEAMCTHRTYRHLAERLADGGFHALRFDYHGTGDSAGHPDEPGRVRAWLENIAAGIDELKLVSGVGTVDLVGVRLGAMLAAVVASQRADVRSLVLWAPCLSGRGYVRELRAFRALKADAGTTVAGSPRPAGEEVAGYWFDQTTLSDLAAIELLALRQPRVERALIVPRDDLAGGEARLATHLQTCGTDATVRAAPGYAQMMLDPQETVVPRATLEGIVSWLAASSSPRNGVGHAVKRPKAVLVTSSRATRHLVREEAVSFGEGGRLFGILTEAERGPLRPGRPAVVFLNVGANHRVGPNRMYVSLARDLAALGYVCLRFDRAGLGDSPSRDGVPEGLVYSKHAVADVKAAMSCLTHTRAAERIVLVGVCSGAHLAFHAGLADSRVAGQVLINPQTFEWAVGDSLAVAPRRSYKSSRYYLGAPLRREVWAQAARGDVDVRGVAGVLRDRLATRAGSAVEDVLAHLRGLPAPRTDVEAAFCTLSDRGVESLLVFSANDGGLDMIEEHLGRGARRVRDRKNIRLEIVVGADHTFTRVRSQREVATLVTRFVERTFP
jgi:pimeloyl-ACP methyl ester carboxylesterase